MTLLAQTDQPLTGKPNPDASKGRIITLCNAFHPERLRVEAFLEEAFAKAFGGKLRSHYPVLMSVRDDADTLLAVAGFRFAVLEPLFLETYLDGAVERIIGEVLRVRVARHEVAEIGNLAAAQLPQARGAAIFLFQALSTYLKSQGLIYAVATATASLRRIFSRVQFETADLGAADPARLQSKASDWGSYYTHDPRVLAGRINTCAAPLESLSLPDLYSRLHVAAIKGER